VSAFNVLVNVIRGAGTILRQIHVPVLAPSKLQALGFAEQFVNMSTASDIWGEAVGVTQIFPPPMGPTAVAA